MKFNEISSANVSIIVVLVTGLAGCGTVTPEMQADLEQNNAAFMQQFQQQMNTISQLRRASTGATGQARAVSTGDPCGGAGVGTCRR